MLLAVPFGLLIGLVVGTVGGGGAILALLVLVYVLGEGIGPATTASLIVVALAAAVAPARESPTGWSVGTSPSPSPPQPPPARSSGRSATTPSTSRFLILTFVPVMLLAAAATWQRASADPEHEPASCPPTALGRTTLAGLVVGALTGFFGVGGGFLIVPVLTIWLGVGFRRAVGTSLAVITLTAAAALASHLLAGAALDVPITATLATATATGALAGTAVAGRLPQHTLGQAFALLVLAVAVFLLVDTMLLGGPPRAT